MARVEFGLVVPADLLDAARRRRYMEDVTRLLNCVQGHYSSAWVIDHLMFDDTDLLEGWTALTYLSALYPALRWGNTVLCQSFRNPALVAKMGATLQLLSGGRFILGLGAGGREQEYRAYGYDYPPGRTRVEQLDEALQIIKALWTQERASFAGKHHRIEDACCAPKPDPQPPIMIGAFGPKMLRLTARHADIWNVSSTSITAYRGLAREFERACADVGRDPATVRRSWCGGCACAPTEREVAALTGPQFTPGEDFMGTPRQLIEQMQPFVELGVDYFLLSCGGFPRLTTVETLIAEVLPALNASQAGDDDEKERPPTQRYG